MEKGKLSRDQLSRLRGSNQPSRNTEWSKPQPQISRPPSTTSKPSEQPSQYQNNQLQNDIPHTTTRGSKLKRKVVLFLVVFLVISGISAGSYITLFKKKTSNSAIEANTQTSSTNDPTSGVNPVALLAGQANNNAPQAQSKLRLIATGDMLPHDAINARAKNGADYDYLQFMSAMKPIFDKAQLRFCNQSVLGGGEAFGISGYPIFNSPTQVQRDMAGVGCNIINTGTNHTNDKTQETINASVAAWDELSTVKAVAGSNKSTEEQNKIHYFSEGGLKFAFLSYSTYTNKPNINPYSLNIYSSETAISQIDEAKKNSDIVLVSMRWGTEYSPSVNSEQDRIAGELAQAGADIVLGHGPHVTQPVKQVPGKDGKETLVWFSLGNFLNAQLDAESLVNCIAVLDIDVSAKKVTNVSCLPIFSSYEWTAAEKSASNLLARKNFNLVTLETAGDLFAKAGLNTTVEAQTTRLQKTLNTYLTIPIIKTSEY